MSLIDIEGKNFRKLINKLIGLTPTWLVGIYLFLHPFKTTNLFPLIYTISYTITALIGIIFIEHKTVNRTAYIILQLSLSLFEIFFLIQYIDHTDNHTITIIYSISTILFRASHKHSLNLIITISYYTYLFSNFGNHQTRTINYFIIFTLLIIALINFIQLILYIKLQKKSILEQIRPYSAVAIQLPLLAIILYNNNIINSDIFFLFSIAFLFNITYNSEQNQAVGDFIHPILNNSYSQYFFLTKIVPLNLVYILIFLFYYNLIIGADKSFNYNPTIFIFTYFIIIFIQGLQFIFSLSPSFFLSRNRVSIIAPFEYLIGLPPLRSNEYFTLYASSDLPLYNNAIYALRSKTSIDLYCELNKVKTNVIIMRGNQTFLNARFTKTPFLLAFTNSDSVYDEFQRKSPLNLMNNNLGNYTGHRANNIKASNEIIKNLRVFDCLELNNLILSKHGFQDTNIYNNIPFDVAYLHQRIISTADKQLRTLANLNFIEITLRYIYFIRCAISKNDIEISTKLSFGYIVSCCENFTELNLANLDVRISNYIDSKKCLMEIGWSTKFGEKINFIELLKISNYIRNKVLGHGSVSTVNEDLLFFTEYITLQVLQVCGKFCKNISFVEEGTDFCRIYSGTNSRKLSKTSFEIIRFKGVFYRSDYLKFHEGYLYVYDGSTNNGKREFINYTNGKRIRPDVIQL